MKAGFLAAAIVSCATAVLFVLWDNYERAFVTAAAGAIGWLLYYRQTLKEKLPKEDEPEEDLAEEETDEEVRS